MKELEEKQFGATPQECFEEGLPDKDGNYYFDAVITDSIYCAPDKYVAHTYYNICKFKTDSPIPNLNYDKRLGEQFGKLLGKTIELLPTVRYRVKAKPERNEQYNEWQYQILNVWETQAQSSDLYANYLRFLTTPNGYKIIMENDKNFVQKVLSDDSFKGERFKGMQQRTYDKIVRELREYKDYMSIIAEFSQFPEITMNTIMAMSDIASNPRQAFKIIKDNPYVLTSLSGFGWKRVDRIAERLNPEAKTSTQRLISYCTYALEEIANASDGGHTWIFINNPIDVKHSMAHLIKENVPECQPCVKDYFALERELTKTRGCGNKFYVDDDKIGLARYFNAEKNILYHLNRINDGRKMEPFIDIDTAISRTNKWMSDRVGEPVTLTEEQENAIKATLDNNVVILTAHAGAGKSTTIRGIIDLWQGKTISCCALAAKAAIRINEVSGEGASTIHRLLEFSQGSFQRNDEYPLDADIVIVDECSMINASLFLSLVRAVKNEAKIILVFDDAQLPAIGAGSVAKDLLGSPFCIRRLTKIHRQAAKSGIKIDANKVRKQIDVFLDDYDSAGELPKYVVHGEKSDMHYCCLRERMDIHSQTLDIYKKLINSEDKQVSANEISIIVPMKSNMENCTDSFNQEIQEILLSHEKQFIISGQYKDSKNSPRIFKKGCRVIRRKNDYEQMVFNGEVGTLIEITSDKSKFQVKFDDDRVIEFKSKELANFDLAYALTVHSMQGSENKTIIFVMDNRHNILLDSTLFYTAITRAKEQNYVVFQPSAYKAALTNDKVCARQTFLPILMNQERGDE